MRDIAAYPHIRQHAHGLERRLEMHAGIESLSQQTLRKQLRQKHNELQEKVKVLVEPW